MNQAPTSLLSLAIAPTRVVRGDKALAESGNAIAQLGNRPLIVGGEKSLTSLASSWKPVLEQEGMEYAIAFYAPDCSEASLQIST